MHRLEVVAKIECSDIVDDDLGILIMFEIVGDIVAATFSDNSFRVMKIRAEQ